jgi:putative PIN family toxin of toxin-antitoxin system
VIVFDASTLVSAAFSSDGVPARAIQHALQEDQVAVSEQVMTELVEVLHRPSIAHFVTPHLRSELLGQLVVLGVPFEPTEPVTDCRDAKDNKYLELALAAGADMVVSSDADLLVLHPWRGVRILRPADYLGEAESGPP